MKDINAWLTDYSVSHQNPTNKIIHWICVPTIFFSIVGFFYSMKLPLKFQEHQLNLALFMLVGVIIYYMILSRTIWIGMLLFSMACLWLCHLISTKVVTPLWAICVALFVIAWIGQFYGHNVEGKKPSFFKDLQFLLIGPAWLMSFIYKKMGIAF
jgi:uncharacterized membrane protein YGL010W